MMVQSITPPVVKSTASIQSPSVKAAGFSASPYQTTLVSAASQSKFKDHFTKAWNYVSDTLSLCLETMLWIVSCGMSASNKIEIAEQIIENPEGMAKEFAAKPKEMMSELIAACIIDPAAVKKLRDENLDKVGEFVRAFKRELPNEKQTFKAGIAPADRTYIHTQFIAFLQERPLQMLEALAIVQADVVHLLGEEKEGEKDEVKALRSLFVDYVPKIISVGKADPSKLSPVFLELNNCFTSRRHRFNPLILSQRPELNDQKGIQALADCLRDDKYCLRVLNEPRLIGLPEAPKLDIVKAGCTAFLKQLSLQDIVIAKKLVEESSLVNGVLGELNGIVKSRSQRLQMADNYQAAWDLINQLDQDLVNPPVKA